MKKSSISLTALAFVALAIQGCTPPPPPVAAVRARVYAEDQQGKAAVCTASEVKVVDGKEAVAKISTGGGGWCALVVSRDGNPYASGLLVEPPRNGRVFVHAVGDDTRIDYTPRPGAVAADSFAVRLIPGDAVIRVTVAAPTAVVGK